MKLNDCSGVFSTGATGAIAPVIFRKRLIAPVILHLPYSVDRKIATKISFALRAYTLKTNSKLLISNWKVLV